MSVRRDPIRDAALKAHVAVARILADAKHRRLAGGLPLAQVSEAVGCSRQRLAALERGQFSDVGTVELARLAAAIGLDLSVRGFPSESPLRDAGQLRLLARLRAALDGSPWRWRTEVPVAANPGDRRAFDVVLEHGAARVAVEAITLFLDSQEQVRPILLKQEAAGLACVILVVSDTRHNRTALAAAGPTLDPAFPLRQRARVLDELLAGRMPAANAAFLL